jgi:hypothetical protein
MRWCVEICDEPGRWIPIIATSFEGPAMAYNSREINSSADNATLSGHESKLYSILI